MNVYINDDTFMLNVLFHVIQIHKLFYDFGTVLSEKFTEEQKKLFSKFVWGRCTLPKCDEDFTSKFRIDSYDVSNGVVDGALPSKFHEKSDQSYFFQIFCGNVYLWGQADVLKLEILFDMIIDRLNKIEHFLLLF